MPSVTSILRSLLGTDHTWFEFMSAVEQHLPVLAKSGRPTAKAIAASAIGRAGYTSWRDMVEAEQGLNWSWNSWCAWRQAWKVVKQNPYLLHTNLSASEVLRISRQITPFPSNPNDLEAFRTIQREQTDERRINSVSGLKKKIAELEADNMALIASQSALAAKLAQAEKMADKFAQDAQRAAEAAGKANSVATELADTKKALDKARQQLAAARAQIGFIPAFRLLFSKIRH